MSHTRTMLAHRARERDEALANREDLSYPPPQLPATACVGTEGWLPSSARSLLKLAAKHGWWAQATRAIGPRIGSSAKVLEQDAYTVVVAVARGTERLAWEWLWNKNKAKWELEDVLSRRHGVLNDTTGRKVIAGEH